MAACSVALVPLPLPPGLQVFWYTVEFGVVREGEGVKAFGAAILSSYGELEHLARVREGGGGSQDP